MGWWRSIAVLAALIVAGLVPPRGLAQTMVTLNSGAVAPQGVALDSAGNVYFTDSKLEIVRELTAADGFNTARSWGPGFSGMVSVATDAAGNVFLADPVTNSVTELLAADGYATVKTLATGFNQPRGIAVDVNGNVFVSDYGNNVVKVIWAKAGYTTMTTLFAVESPAGLAVDASDNVFVISGLYSTFPASAMNPTLQVFTCEVPAAGFYLAMNNINTGAAAAAALAVDHSGNLFVADAFGGVSEVPAAGGYATPKNLAGSFVTPLGVAVDGDGNVFVAESDLSFLGISVPFTGGGVYEIPAAGGYASVAKLGSGFYQPASIAVAPSGDLFVADQGHGALKRIEAAGGYASVDLLQQMLTVPNGIAVDRSGNVFVGDTGVLEIPLAGGGAGLVPLSDGIVPTVEGVAVDANANVFAAYSVYDPTAGPTQCGVEELVATGGYARVNTFGDGFGTNYCPMGLALDSGGNAYVTAPPFGASILELPAAGGYSTISMIGAGLLDLQGDAVDAKGDIFVANAGQANVVEIPAVGGQIPAEPSLVTFPFAFGLPSGVAVDGSGNIFVADTHNGAIDEILAGPPTLFAAVLPTARAVQVGAPATIFATMINTGPTALEGCGISFFPGQLSSPSYQATDPATNQPIGAPNTPVSIPGQNGSQSFIVTLQTGFAFSYTGQPLNFSCASGNTVTAAPIVQGVDTVDLFVSSTPIADIVLLPATPSRDGILRIPEAGAAAFAVASDNIGAAEPVLLTLDTGAAALPVTATICPTNPTTGQCLAPPTTALFYDFGSGATPTFSVFAQASGAIPFNPAASRLFVHIRDGNGNSLSSTSVAVETQ